MKRGGGGTYIVRILRTLINSDERHTPATLRPQPKRLHEFQHIGTVQPPRAIIPTLYRCPTQYTLSDIHPRPLPPRHAPDEVVAHFSVEGVCETEHGEDDAAHVSCVHRSGDGWKTVTTDPGFLQSVILAQRRTSQQSESSYKARINSKIEHSIFIFIFPLLVSYIISSSTCLSSEEEDSEELEG